MNSINMLTSKGYAIGINNRGESVIETYMGDAQLTRDESILWFACRYDVATEQEVYDRYYRTVMSMGITAPEIEQPFASLCKKGLITFGRDTNLKDAVYRMLCQGVLFGTSLAAQPGKNKVDVDFDVVFPPVITRDKPLPALANDIDIARIEQSIVADEWMFPEIVDHYASGYPAAYTHADARDDFIAKHSDDTVFEVFSDAVSPLKNKYYRSDAGRCVGMAVTQLIATRHVVIL